MEHMVDNNGFPNNTPNVVVTDPRVRKVAGIVLGVAALVLPIAQIIDSSAENLDWSQFLNPATAIALFLAGAFQLGITTPNVPSYK
jgi:hypothetical protein